MLEHYFTKPVTADRIRETWIGKSIEEYVVWLSDQGYSARTVHKHVPLLRRFGEIAGIWVQENLKNYQTMLIRLLIWMREHKRRATKKRSLYSIRREC